MDANIGLVTDYAFNWTPRGWLACNGQLVTVNNNAALYSLLGTVYGGDGRTTFGVPDLRGRCRMGQGTAPGLTARILGQKNGAEYHTLTEVEMPLHNHTATFTPTGGSSGAPLTATLTAAVVNATSNTPSDGAYLATTAVNAASGAQDKPEYIYYSGAAPTQTAALAGLTVTGGGGGITGGTVTVGDTGGSSAFSILSPVQVLNPCICADGIYPSRN